MEGKNWEVHSYFKLCIPSAKQKALASVRRLLFLIRAHFLREIGLRKVFFKVLIGVLWTGFFLLS